MQPGTDTTKTSAPDPIWVTPANPRRRQLERLLVATMAFAFLATWVGGCQAIQHQRREIDRLDNVVSRERAIANRMAARVDALGSAQVSMATEVGRIFDPAAIVTGAKTSVFTLRAGLWQGSAFVIASGDHDATMVTNYHVVRDLWTIGVRTVVIRRGSTSFNATIARVQPRIDLAFLDVRSPLPALLPDPDAPQVGEPIVVLGSPYGLGSTVSTGVVSAVRARYVQFSAPVSPGSSGGPVLDARGRVIGVAAAKLSGPGAEGLSFAIPIWRVCQLTVAC